MPELGTLGSVRGALSNERPYRDLRNVGAKYPFERSHRFGGIQLNSGHGDDSPLSCSAADSSEKARIGRDLFSRSGDDRPAAKPATPLLSLRWTLSAHGACVWAQTPGLNGSRLFPATAPWVSAGLRWWRRDVCADSGALLRQALATIRRRTKCTRSVATLKGDCQQCLRLRVDGIIFIARRCAGSAQSISYVRSQLCEMCLKDGRINAATIADHIERHRVISKNSSSASFSRFV